MVAQRFVLNTPSIIGEAIDDEVMIINLVSGIYYNVTGTGAAAWPLLAAGVPVREIVDKLGETCEVDRETIARDFLVFVNQLLAEAIIRAADQGDEFSGIVQPLRAGSYTGFAVARYQDMQALLVVDPVHEVGDFGWPPEPPRTPQ